MIISNYDSRATSSELRTSNDSRFTIHDSLSLKVPVQENESQENLPSQIDLNTIPHFPKPAVTNTTIPLNTSLKLVADNFIDAKTAKIGDYFKAHVSKDFYIQANPPQLILPKGSWVRGRISFLKRPNFFIKAGKIGLHLDELVTPLGETFVLDTELDVQKGILSEDGILKPQTTKPSNSQFLPDSILTVPVNNLETLLIDKLLSGKLFALFAQTDTTTLSRGQELQIVFNRNIQLIRN
ncbi:MAG: hypothetical protein A3I68_01210 [Candidatus Melainabacteria bacterium RIFCSPLOWO2_02_FULL_35_15]|nr:MAG: hypothetical protein A3F80_09035 [Candidatus Melainabacteria bacterium RIFCSPLOWO2_12_FULL_35_11]OGI13392.1 MAG: hypothetical protein A3I68_01210 [Candidatus Melainabacteria bacterium RIFCSPLOWO2_02_FULL_35_15]